MYRSKWYDRLSKSPYTPPPYVFSIVWPILYTMILASAVLYYYGKTDSWGWSFFGIQFALNLIWPWLFFTQRMIGWSLANILALEVFIVTTILQFYKTNPYAAYLLIPYAIWVGFASYLNLYIYLRN